MKENEQKQTTDHRKSVIIYKRKRDENKHTKQTIQNNEYPQHEKDKIQLTSK